MATTLTPNQALVLKVPPELLGPGSEYEIQRLKLRNDNLRLITDAQKITAIVTVDDLEIANNAGRVLQVASKECENFFTPVKRQVDDLKKPILLHEKELVGQLDVEKRRLGGLITQYNIAQEKIRQEAERAAREVAEAEERERLLNLAVEAESAGDSATAQAILDEPVIAPPVVIQQSAPTRMAGQVGKLTYSCVVENLKELVKAVAEGRAPIGCILANESYLNNRARDDKENFSIPGCKLNSSRSTHFRS